MVAPRRAAMRGATPSLVTGVRAALTVVSLALAGVLSALARRVGAHGPSCGHPGRRACPTRASCRSTPRRRRSRSRGRPTPSCPGRYGLFTSGTASYIKLGSVLSEDDVSVKRKLLTHIPADAQLSPDAAFSGWYYDSADELHLPYTPELIGSAVGPCPAWLFPAGSGDVWVIQVHGRGTTRAECLRAVPVFHALGITSLVVSYRNDGEAPRSRAGPTRSARRNGATSTPPSASPGAAAPSASC